ncbi:Uncharacterized conserved protein [Leminorella richardii]|uniref:Uncharacterized conserved protein n=1 Tax=Leminorella richardii TaxID=158841 RepID=A0A2X4URK6_9GAMM|nr:cyclophilin-like fold protein [Leminorella richardii]SQI41431.1 Uncharacterized conserved protein [Leminorella richardii]
MKKRLFLSFCLIANGVFPVHANNLPQPGKENPIKIKMTIHQQSYDVELEDNPTTKALIKRLPLTLTMQELNGNEKFADLSSTLPISPIGPGTIHEGELMLYGRQTLVLFYQTFQTSYSYTSIGRIIASDTLQNTVGHSNISVNFSMVE